MRWAASASASVEPVGDFAVLGLPEWMRGCWVLSAVDKPRYCLIWRVCCEKR